MDIFEIFRAPGDWLLTQFVVGFGYYDIDPGTGILIAYVLSFFVWVLGLRLVGKIAGNILKSARGSGSDNSGPTLGKSIAWLWGPSTIGTETRVKGIFSPELLDTDRTLREKYSMLSISSEC